MLARHGVIDYITLQFKIILMYRKKFIFITIMSLINSIIFDATEWMFIKIAL